MWGLPKYFYGMPLAAVLCVSAACAQSLPQNSTAIQPPLPAYEGTWDGATSAAPRCGPAKLHLIIRNNEITGQATSIAGNNQLSGRIAPDGSFSWQDDTRPNPASAQGAFSGDKFSGTVALPCGELALSGSRTSRDFSAAVPNSAALATADDTIAQKCVVGWHWVAITHLEFYYLPGGEIQGIRHDPKGITTFAGTWEVKNGALRQHTAADNSVALRENIFPIEMLPNGLCFITTGGHKRLMWKDGKPLGTR